MNFNGLFCFILWLLKIYSHTGGLHSRWTVLLSRERRVKKLTCSQMNEQDDFP